MSRFDLYPVDSLGMLLAMSAPRSKRIFRSHLRFALNSFLPYHFRPSIRLASPDPPLTIFGSEDERRRIVVGEAKKYWIVAMWGLLHEMQNQGQTETEMAIKVAGELLFSIFY